MTAKLSSLPLRRILLAEDDDSFSEVEPGVLPGESQVPYLVALVGVESGVEDEPCQLPDRRFGARAEGGEYESQYCC